MSCLLNVTSQGFADLDNADERHCLTFDCSGVNKNNPGRYRTQTGDPEKQVCYFNKPRDDELYNVFISSRIKTENFSNGIYVKVDRVQGKDETFDAEKTLKQDDIHDRFSKRDTNSEPTAEFHGRGKKNDMRKLLSTLTEGLESQLDSGFFQDNNHVQRKQKQQRNIVTQK